MAFVKKTWKNRIAEYINRRLLTNEDGSTNLVTVARDEGTISQEGDAFNAANMNDLEDRIESEFNEINQSLTWNREKIDNNLGFDITCLKCDFICFINIQRLNNGDKDVDSNILIPSAYKSLIRIAVSNYSSEREAFAELYENKLRIYAKQGHWVNISILYPVNEHN